MATWYVTFLTKCRTRTFPGISAFLFLQYSGFSWQYSWLYIKGLDITSSANNNPKRITTIVIWTKLGERDRIMSIVTQKGRDWRSCWRHRVEGFLLKALEPNTTSDDMYVGRFQQRWQSDFRELFKKALDRSNCFSLNYNFYAYLSPRGSSALYGMEG